ncbi:MAG: rhodanese-like domain-containing protein [Proteobacteria bacterium]|nr:rhodanese-like domain-containing protein [Pseudomonadota bacterium]MCL2307240.1 rhodanese-like domain-containing protein [Pseudomonadota bacterium]
MKVKQFRLLAVTAALVLASGGGFTLSANAEAQTGTVQTQAAFATVGFDAVKKATGDGTRPGAKAMIIDVRAAEKYQAGTIPSSRNVPFSDKPDLAVLGNWDKAREVIVFDDGAEGQSVTMANVLKAQGYADVKIYAEGLKGWQAKSYLEVGTQVVQAAFNKNAAVLMDARPYPRFLGGTIPGALAVPDSDVEKLASRFPINKNEPIITFCSGFDCDKSHAIAGYLWSNGYRNVQVYAAGYPAWKAAGLQTTEGGAKPAAKPASPAPAASAPAKFVNGIKLGADEGSVDGQWFKEQLQANKLPAEVLLIDVRKEGVYNNGHINGAINKPVADLSSADIPKDRIVVFVCMTGSTALESYMKIQKEGKADMSRVYYFDANIKCNEKGACEIEPNEPLG